MKRKDFGGIMNNSIKRAAEIIGVPEEVGGFEMSENKEDLLLKEELLREMRSFGLQCDRALDLKAVQEMYEREIRPAKCRFLNSMLKPDS